jgi:hypothetical protein
LSRFGGGQVAATALRGRVLERLGAELEWTVGDHDDSFVSWTAGPATTFFCVEDGPDGAPDLGVFRVFTPVATVGDVAAALTRCNTLNAYATTNRWMIAPGSYEDAEAEMIWIGCSFVVGPHNQAALETFVTRCVQEQIATATAGMTSGLAEQLGGKPCILENEDDRHREETGWSEVVRHSQNVVEPGKNKRADDLAVRLQGAFLSLRGEMLAEGRGAWYSPEPDSYPLSCEMPANWSGYEEDIRWIPGQSGPPMAGVKAHLTAWGDLGNGLLITMSPPGYSAGSDDVANQLNRLDEHARGATHFVGAWTGHQHDLIYLVFLPAALLEQDIAWPVVMREILLTFARQAQLARHVVIEPDARRILDGGAVQPAGLEASLRPHGLAWGETGEGRNPAASYLDGIYHLLVGDDSDWACPAANGLTWWPYQQAREITVIPPDDAPAPVREPVLIRISTEVGTAVPVAPQALTAIAKRNASLAESALVLRDDGTLVLTSQLALDVAIGAAGANKSKPAPASTVTVTAAAAAAAAPTVTVTARAAAAAPTVTVTATATPAAAPHTATASNVLIIFSGSSIPNSAPFVVNSSAVTAHYNYGCSAFGSSGNFIADMVSGSPSIASYDDQSIANDSAPAAARPPRSTRRTRGAPTTRSQL